MSRMTMPELIHAMIHPDALREQIAACRASGGVPIHRPGRGAAAMGAWAPAMDAGEDRRREPFVRVGSAAVLPVDGPITYGDSFLSWLFGGTSNQSVVAAVNAAAADPNVEALYIDWHCPGGDVAGASDLVDAIDRCAAVKPVVSLVHDLCGSLAYWAACRGTRVLMTPSGLVGSIGAINVAYDASVRAARDGVEAVVTTDAPQKAYGIPGAPITPEMRERESTIIGRMGGMFRAHVAEKRGLTPEAILAMQGAVYFGQDGVEAGLVDEIITADAFYARVVRGEHAPTTRPTPAASQPGAAAQAAPRTEPAKEPTMSKVKDQYNSMTDEEKKEMKALMEEDDTAAETEEEQQAETKDDENKAEGGEGDKPSAAAPVTPAQAIATAKAAVRDASPGLPDTEINRLAMESVEHGWSEARLYREVDKAERAMAGLAEQAGGSADAVGGARPATGGASFGTYDQAVASYEAQGKSTAEAVAIVNREHPDLRAKKFAKPRKSA